MFYCKSHPQCSKSTVSPYEVPRLPAPTLGLVRVGFKSAAPAALICALSDHIHTAPSSRAQPNSTIVSSHPSSHGSNSYEISSEPITDSQTHIFTGEPHRESLWSASPPPQHTVIYAGLQKPRRFVMTILYYDDSCFFITS